MRSSFVFYRSFNEAMEELSETDQLVLYRAIVDYGLDGRETVFDSSYLRMAWKLIKPQLDANWRRYENGCKGGAPVGSRNNPSGRRGNQPRTNQELTKNKRNDNDNDNDNDNVDNKESKPKKDELSLPLSPSTQKFVQFNLWLETNCPHLLKMEQMTEKELDTLLLNYQSEDIFNTLRKMENYRDTAKKNRSVYRTLRNWLNRDDKKKGGNV
jgi:hypothetical protein